MRAQLSISNTMCPVGDKPYFLVRANPAVNVYLRSRRDTTLRDLTKIGVEPQMTLIS